MTLPFEKGRFRARLAVTPDDLDAALALRYRAFVSEAGPVGRADCRETDAFDEICQHVLIEDTQSGGLVCVFRYLVIGSGRDIEQTYSAQFYHLEALHGYSLPMIEVGRFCLVPGAGGADALRMAWGALAQIVTESRAEMLFGCSSFQGVDTAPYHDAFAVLRDKYIAPAKWLPTRKAPTVFQYSQGVSCKPDLNRALQVMPPLLRSYLGMGGWVSDHAVVDRDLNTLHVFTGLEIQSIPPRRRAALLGVAS